VSDFSGLEQSFTLPALTPEVSLPPLARGIPEGRERSYDVVLDEVEFHPLRDADAMHAIQKLRAEIQLPGKAVADPAFVTREKKETGRGSSVLSNGMRTSSGR
jgi:hypothetical protein